MSVIVSGQSIRKSKFGQFHLMTQIMFGFIDIRKLKCQDAFFIFSLIVYGCFISFRFYMKQMAFTLISLFFFLWLMHRRMILWFLSLNFNVGQVF